MSETVSVLVDAGCHRDIAVKIWKEYLHTEIANTHHFNKDIILTVNPEKCVWKYKGRVLNPSESLEDFILLIDIVFRFTGVCFDVSYTGEFTDYFNKNKESNMDTLEVIQFIYKQPLERKVKFIHIQTCGCNMGYCGAITGVDVDNNEYKTYGDLMALFGDNLIINDKTYYGYPDSVMFSIRTAKLPKSIHSGGTCYSEKIPLNISLDPDTEYLEWQFCR